MSLMSYIKGIFFSVTLYPAFRAAGKGNLVLRHSVAKNFRFFPDGKTQRLDLPRYKSEEIKMLNILFSQV